MAKNPPIAVTRDQERQVWMLLQNGRTQISIAEEIGISPATVCRMIKRVNESLAKEFRVQAEQIKAQHTVQLEDIFQEAMRVWEESEGEIRIERKSVKREVVYGEDKKPKLLKDEFGEIVRDHAGQPVSEMIEFERTENTETRQQFGDPRYLAEARAAKADIRKIWGLDAVKDDGPAIVIQKAYVNVPVDDV